MGRHQRSRPRIERGSVGFIVLEIRVSSRMKCVYGPVSSWRLGRSLGVDPICSRPKVCSFDCVYCQLGERGLVTVERSRFTNCRWIYESLPDIVTREKPEVITFSGTGEPTLASNLGEMAEAVREISRLPLAILTNSSLFSREDVRRDLQLFDAVIAKLDAVTEPTFAAVNRPYRSIRIENVLGGIRLAREELKDLRLQLMFISLNAHEAGAMARFCEEVQPDMVYINTPLRPCGVSPLSEEELGEIVKLFSGMPVRSVYRSLDASSIISRK